MRGRSVDDPPQGSCADQEKRLLTVLALYLKLVPIEFLSGLVWVLKSRRNGVFTLPVVIWLMIFQRLHDKGTLAVAVQQVICGLPAVLAPRPSKRLRERAVSSHTGGYNQARQKLPLEVVRQVNDRVFEGLQIAKRAQTASRRSVQMFVLDGSTLLMPRTPALLEAYPPSRNQHGESHWPMIRVLVAHDLHSGVAVRPQWGPANGPNALSEQRLTDELMERLPARAGILGDRNFGVFSVAWTAQQRGHPVLLRLMEKRAKHAFGTVLCSRTDLQVDWKPSRYDRAAHPGLPRDACVHGRLIVRKVYPSDGSAPFKLYLFTTLNPSPDEIVQLYGLRWNVETDLRTIKRTIRLEMLSCQTPEMVAKELILAVTAYNLVRAVIDESAQRTQLSPRQYSFSRVQDVVNAWLPRIVSMASEVERQAEYELMMKYVAQCKLYKRKKRKSYPRAVWQHSNRFPGHSAACSQPSHVKASPKTEQS
jgi:putative transposase